MKLLLVALLLALLGASCVCADTPQQSLQPNGKLEAVSTPADAAGPKADEGQATAPAAAISAATTAAADDTQAVGELPSNSAAAPGTLQAKDKSEKSDSEGDKDLKEKSKKKDDDDDDDGDDDKNKKEDGKKSKDGKKDGKTKKKKKNLALLPSPSAEARCNATKAHNVKDQALTNGDMDCNICTQLVERSRSNLNEYWCATNSFQNNSYQIAACKKAAVFLYCVRKNWTDPCQNKDGVIETPCSPFQLCRFAGMCRNTPTDPTVQHGSAMNTAAL